MKNLIFIVALSLGVGFANAQKVKEADVPAAVKDGFKKQFPASKVEGWEKEGGNYEAEFDQNKVEASALFDASGKLLETEVEIKVSELPKAVTDYMNKNVPGKKIKEASKITDAAGKISYEAEAGEADYIFDANGGFVKKEVEKEDDKDDVKK